MSLAFNADTLRLLVRYETARKALAMWDEEKTKARAELLAAMGDESEATYLGKPVLTVSRTRPRRFDQAAFIADHPNLAEQYRAEGNEEIRLILAKNLPVVPSWHEER